MTPSRTIDATITGEFAGLKTRPATWRDRYGEYKRLRAADVSRRESLRWAWYLVGVPTDEGEGINATSS